MNHVETHEPGLDRMQRIAMFIGAVGILACVVGAFLDAGQFLLLSAHGLEDNTTSRLRTTHHDIPTGVF